MTRMALALVAVTLAVPGSSYGQTPGASQPPASLSVGATGGLSAGAMTTGGAIGGTLAFDATDRVTLEGRGLWQQGGTGSDAVEAAASLMLTVYRGDTASPYVSIGGGLYRVQFDLDDRRMFGSETFPFAPGTVIGPVQPSGVGMMGGGRSSHGATWMGGVSSLAFDTAGLPMFYATRLASMAVPVDGRWGTRSFTDPALTLGVGVRLDLGRRFYVRPDLRALVGFGGGSASTLATATGGFCARF
ncbi:MAG: hypothetical protein AB7I50_16065 [Vicinamibacterales bacterium]